MPTGREGYLKRTRLSGTKSPVLRGKKVSEIAIFTI
jgi:hypothetical protein